VVVRAVVAASLVVAAVATASASAEPAAPSASGYIVAYRDFVDVDVTTDRLAGTLGVAPDFRYRHALHGFAASLTPGQLEQVRADPAVRFVSPDGVLRIEGTVPIKPGESVPPGIRRIGAATNTRVQKKGKNVAIIDTGVSLTHPDLNAVSGTDCVQPGTPADDDNGHGTHMAGVVGAKNQGSGIVGVSPGARVVAVKVLNASGTGSFAQVICGIDWVTANRIAQKLTVALVSLGGAGSDDSNCGNSNGDALHQAICRSTAAGVAYVATAGSSAGNFASTVPAAYDEVLTVTAMADTDGMPGGLGPACSGQNDDSFATFSSFAVLANDIAHTIAAPGVCIMSTGLNGSYRTLSGTASASAHVAGVVSVCRGHKNAPGPCAGLNAAQTVQKVRADAAAHATPQNGFEGDPNDPIPGRHYGFLVWAGSY
jgi:subtilisin family serine protease